MNPLKDLTGFDFAGSRVTVMGLGRFGGGVGVARWLVEQGADVLVTDLLDEASLTESLRALDGLPIQYRLGEHRICDFTDTDLVIANPAVDRRNNRFLRASEAASLPITTEIEILLSQIPREQIIAITGSAGKSTTTAMLGHVLTVLMGKDRVFVGGNIGGSLLGKIAEIKDDALVILEMSSFMLEPITGWSPRMALVTNLSPNHLDRHGDMVGYAAAKQSMITGDLACELVLLGKSVADWSSKANADSIQVITEFYQGDLSLPGEHNQLNASFVIAVTEALGLDMNEVALALKDFAGLPHRMQLVAEHNGLLFYNDSKSTTPASALLGMQSFEAGQCHVILGGYDKGADLREMAEFAAEHCAGVYAIGATSAQIVEAAKSSRSEAECDHIADAGTLESAFRILAPRLKKNQVLLLSPGCASLDQFKNYEERAAKFTELVLGLCSESGLEFSSSE